MTTQSYVGRTGELTERVFGELLSEHRLEIIPELYAEDCTFYGMGDPGAIDRDAYEAFLTAQFEAFPDLSFDVEETIVDPDGKRTAVRWTAHGTHDGTFGEIPATGEAVTVTGMSFLHLDDDEIVEAHTDFDMLGLLRQIGAVPGK